MTMNDDVVSAQPCWIDSRPSEIITNAAVLRERSQPWRPDMKRLCLLPVLLALVAVPSVRADQKDDDAAIHKRHDEWCAAWNKHDPKAMAAFFFADGELINPFGRHADGTAAIEKLFTDEHTGPMAGTTYSG